MEGQNTNNNVLNTTQTQTQTIFKTMNTLDYQANTQNS